MINNIDYVIGSPYCPTQPTRCRISRFSSVSWRSASTRSAPGRPLDAVGSPHHWPTADGATRNAWPYNGYALGWTSHASTPPRIQVYSCYAKPAQPSMFFFFIAFDCENWLRNDGCFVIFTGLFAIERHGWIGCWWNATSPRRPRTGAVDRIHVGFCRSQ